MIWMKDVILAQTVPNGVLWLQLPGLVGPEATDCSETWPCLLHGSVDSL